MKTVWSIVALAGLLTGLNAWKPLHVDDPTYSFLAHQIAAHPLDPYGFNLLYFSDPLPALHVLAPPVQPAWWALGIRLFGDHPVLWKLWMFPFAFLFVASSALLLRRFAPSVATPLLVMLTLSPVFLPTMNLMLDIPAMSLSLTALALFLHACDRGSFLAALFAGLIGGLAMQTKYTGFLAPAVMLAYAVLHRHWRLGLSAAAMACVVFVAWELFLVWRYGESHFRYHTSQAPFDALEKLGLIVSLLPILGAVTPTLFLLALVLSGSPRRWFFAAAGFALLPYLLICWFDPIVVDFRYDYLPLTGVLFGGIGVALLLSMAWMSWRFLRPVRGKHIDRMAWFLVLWFLLELAGYAALSPFPAVRRIMGLTVAATLLLGYVAERTALEGWRRKALHGLVAATAFLGFIYCGIDFLEAKTEQQASYDAVRRIRQDDPDAVIWYTGYWGFQYYAEEAGMKQAVPQLPDDNPLAHLLPPTHFRHGDWLVVPDDGIPQQQLDLQRPELELKDRLRLDDAVPLRTLIYFHAGTPPLRHRYSVRLEVRLFRVRKDFMARLCF